MARAVIVRFANNAEAERFVRTIANDGYVYANPATGPVQYAEEMTPAECSIAAVVAVPTKACTCNVIDTGTRRRRASKRDSGWVRSKRYGWWICSRCNKPSRPMITHFITCMLVGANDLLHEILGDGDPISAQKRWERDGGTGRPEIRMGDHYEHV